MALDKELEEEIKVAVSNGATKSDIISITEGYKKKKDEPTDLKESSSDLEGGPSSSEPLPQTEVETEEVSESVTTPEPQGGPRLPNNPVFTLQPGERLTPSLPPDFFNPERNTPLFSENPNVDNTIQKVAKDIVELEEFDEDANLPAPEMEWGPTEFELISEDPLDIRNMPTWKQCFILGGRDVAQAMRSLPYYADMVKQNMGPVSEEGKKAFYRPSASSAIYKIKDDQGNYLTIDSDFVNKISEKNRERKTKRAGKAAENFAESLRPDKEFEEGLEMPAYDKDFIGLLKEGRIGDASSMVLNTTLRTLPPLLTAAATAPLTGPLAPVTAYTLYGLIGASNATKEVMDEEWYQSMSPEAKLGYATIMGGLEIVPDAVAGKILARTAKQVLSRGMRKEIFDRTSKEIFKGMTKGVGLNFGSEAIAEGATGFGSSVTEDVFKGEPVDLQKAFRRGLNDGSLGGFSGGTIGGPVTIREAASLGNSLLVDAEVAKANYDINKYRKLASEAPTEVERASYLTELEDALDRRAQRTSIKREQYQFIGKKDPKALTDLVKINSQIQSKVNSIRVVEDASTKSKLLDDIKVLRTEFNDIAGKFASDFVSEDIKVEEATPVETPKIQVTEEEEVESTDGLRPSVFLESVTRENQEGEITTDPKLQELGKVGQNIEELLGDVEVIIHDGTFDSTMDKVSKQGSLKNESARFIVNTKNGKQQIHVESRNAQPIDIIHDAFHVVFAREFGQDQEIARVMSNRLRDVMSKSNKEDAALVKRIDDVINSAEYAEGLKGEEFLADVAAELSGAYGQLSQSGKSKFKNTLVSFIDEILKKFGINIGAFTNVRNEFDSDQRVVNFLNAFSKVYASGAALDPSQKATKTEERSKLMSELPPDATPEELDQWNREKPARDQERKDALDAMEEQDKKQKKQEEQDLTRNQREDDIRSGKFNPDISIEDAKEFEAGRKERREKLQQDYNKAVGDIAGNSSFANVATDDALSSVGNFMLDFEERSKRRSKLITRRGVKRYQPRIRLKQRDFQGVREIGGAKELIINAMDKIFLLQRELEDAGVDINLTKDVRNKLILGDSAALDQSNKFEEDLGTIIETMNSAGMGIDQTSDLLLAMTALGVNEVGRVLSDKQSASGMSDADARKELAKYGIDKSATFDDLNGFLELLSKSSEKDTPAGMKSGKEIAKVVKEWMSVAEGTREILMENLMPGGEIVEERTGPFVFNKKRDEDGNQIEINEGEVYYVLVKEKTGEVIQNFPTEQEATKAKDQRAAWSETYGDLYVPLWGFADPSVVPYLESDITSDLQVDNKNENNEPKGEKKSKFKVTLGNLADGLYRLVSGDIDYERSEKIEEKTPEERPQNTGPSKAQGVEVTKPVGRRKGRDSKAGNILVNLIIDRKKAISNNHRNEVLIRFYNLLNDPISREVLVDNKLISTRKFDGSKDKLSKVASDPNQVQVRINGDRYIIEFSEDMSYLATVLKGGNMMRMGLVASAFKNLTTFRSRTLTQWSPDFWIPNFERDFGMAFISLGGKKQQKIFGISEKSKAEQTKELAKIRFQFVSGILPSMKAIGQEALGKKSDNKYLKYFEEFKKYGAKTGFMSQDDVRALRKKLKNVDMSVLSNKATSLKELENGVKFAADVFAGINDIFENSSRLSAFVAARDRGVSPEKAAELAKELTVNFNQVGSMGPLIGSYLMFFNAGAQGSNAVYQNLFSTLDAVTMSAMLTGLGFMTQMINYGIGDEDDEPVIGGAEDKEYGRKYIELEPDYLRSTRLGYYKPSGLFLGVYEPYGYNVFPSLGKGLFDMQQRMRDPNYAGSLGGDMTKLLQTTFSAFSPVAIPRTSEGFMSPKWFVKNTLGQTGLAPVADLITNETWFGSPIYKEKKRNKINEYYFEADKGGSYPARWLSEALATGTEESSAKKDGKDYIAPKALDYAFQQIAPGPLGFANRNANWIDGAYQGSKVIKDTDDFKKAINRVLKGESENVKLKDISFIRAFVAQPTTDFEANKEFSYLLPYLKRSEEISPSSEDIIKGKQIEGQLDFADSGMTPVKLRRLRESYKETEAKIRDVKDKLDDEVQRLKDRGLPQMSELRYEKELKDVYKKQSILKKNWLRDNRTNTRLFLEAMDRDYIKSGSQE